MKKNNEENERQWKSLILKISDIAFEKLGVGWQKKLAEITSLQPSNVSRIFSLKYTPSLKNLVLITSSLGLDLLKGSYSEEFPKFIWGDAKTTHPYFEFLIHWHEPKVIIGVPINTLLDDFETWRNEIIIDSPYPIDDQILNEIKIGAWNFLANEEIILENDVSDIDFDDI